MDPNVLGGIARAIVPTVVALVLAKFPGLVGPVSDWIVAGIVSIGAAAWSVKTNVTPSK